jgi:hypothetical protein
MIGVCPQLISVSMELVQKCVMLIRKKEIELIGKFIGLNVKFRFLYSNQFE